MKINSKENFEYMCAIKEETKKDFLGETFFSNKLQKIWLKAKETAAYKNIGDYSIDNFLLLPITEKMDLKSNPFSYVRVSMKDAMKYYQTTGTTGVPTPTPRTVKDMIANIVSVSESWRKMLLNSKHKVLILLPSDIVPVADLFVGVCEYLDICHSKAYPYTVGISDWEKIICLWDVLKPTILVIAPGVLSDFTQLLKRRSLLEKVSESVEKIMVLGEVSTPEFRAIAGNWWNAQILDASYGSTESGTLATCCEHDNLHLLVQSNYFEVENDGCLSTIDKEVSGNLIVTPLNNDARPLLRLNMGDEVTIKHDCSCGRLEPYIIVHGRESDKISLKDVLVSTRDIEQVVYGNVGAAGYLIEMKKDGSYVHLLLEREYNFSKDFEPQKIEKLQNSTYSDLGFLWDKISFVNRLPAITKSGGSQKSWKKTNINFIENEGQND